MNAPPQLRWLHGLLAALPAIPKDAAIPTLVTTELAPAGPPNRSAMEITYVGGPTSLCSNHGSNQLPCCETSYAGGLVIRGNRFGGPDGKAFGIVQVSCGLHVGKFRHGIGRQRFTELNEADVHAINRGLRSAFSPDGQFLLEGLGAGAQSNRLPHTWLGGWSRHQPVGMPTVFFPGDSDGRGCPDSPDFPDALKWPGRRPEATLSSTHVRLQRVVDEASASDYNDRIVTYTSADGDSTEIAPCDQLRNFFAWLYAQRRSAIYASNLSERIYHIWLPSGLLSTAPHSPDNIGPLVILPLVTMVRRPNQLAWRHTIGISIIFVPVQREEGGRLSPRPLICDGSREVEFLTRSLEGGSTGIRPYGRSLLFLEDCPFRRYVAGLMEIDRHPSVIPGMRQMLALWQATPRQWIELCSTLAADAVGKWDTKTSLHKRRLSDAVLRSLRSTAVWSVAVTGQGLDCLEDRGGLLWPVPSGHEGKVAASRRKRISRRASSPLEDYSEHLLTDFPAWARSALRMLSSPGTLPRKGDRVDDVSCIDMDFMTWQVPRRRCLVTMMGISNEHFPRSSLLYLFGWIGHMVIAAASATETMLELGREIALPLPVAQLADTAYQFTLELEEMYDLDSTWLIFTRFFRNIRKSLGIDGQYKGIRERVDLLARHAEVNERIRTERETVEVTIIGAILAIVLIALATFTVPDYGSMWYFRLSVIGGSVLLVLLLIIYRFVRSKRRWLRRLQ